MKYYVFGSNGMMGKYFCSVAKEDAVPLTRKDYDITTNNKSNLVGLLFKKGIQPGDIIVNCAGAVKQRDFSLQDYVTINSLFPHQLEDTAREFGCKLIHLTTDCVYDGQKGMYSENDSHTCTDWYGKSKSLGEPENSCCIRTSIIGLGSAGNVSLLDWFANETSHSPLNGYVNHMWNGVTCLELSKYIIRHKDNLWSGTRHIYSNPVSKYDLLQTYNELFELGKTIVPIKADVPCDRTLCSNHMGGMVSNSIEKQLKELSEYHENSIR